MTLEVVLGALWIVVLAQFLMVVALARQIGLLHSRLPPSGALVTNAGPPIGSNAAPLELPRMEGGVTRVDAGLPAMLVFILPSCGVCSKIVGDLKALERRERIRVFVASLTQDADSNRAFVASAGLTPMTLYLGADLAARWGISSTPQAVVLDALGVVRSKGIVNNLEQIESLLEARWDPRQSEALIALHPAKSPVTGGDA